MSCAQREHLWYEDHRPVVALSAADLFVNEFRDSDFMQRRATLQEEARTSYLGARRAFVIHSSEHGWVRGGFLGEKGEQFLIRIGRSPGRHHPAEVAQRGVSRASPGGFIHGVFLEAGQVFGGPYGYIFFSGCQCALHGALKDIS
jgi:hypothetical protein